jgi:hypothetical protein
VLGHSDFGITDNFFAVGGHSLAAARLVSRLEQTIGSAPELAALFHNSTIAGLVQLMQGAVSGLSPSLVTLQPKGERPPLFVIHGWGGTVWGFVDLARALAPDRPVYGLPAPGVEWQRPPQGRVRVMAAGDAEQIQHDGQGFIAQADGAAHADVPLRPRIAAVGRDLQVPIGRLGVGGNSPTVLISATQQELRVDIARRFLDGGLQQS